MELKNLFKLSALTVALSVVTACGSDDKEEEQVLTCETNQTVVDGVCVNDKTDQEIAEEALEAEYLAATGVEVDVEILGFDGEAITEDKTLTTDKVYALRGPVVVGNDNADSAVLTIEAGVTIFGETGNDYLVVSRGSQIMAEGTAEAPIIMTSKNDILGEEVGPGQWGGVVILGNAKSNKCTDKDSGEYDANCSLQVEGAFEGAVFGGSDDTDNSGVLQYVVVKYAGFEIAPDNELNGITFGAVGSGTTVDHIQVHANADDGVEFFGGTVNVSYLVLTGNQDDSIDWDNGYRGTIQYAYVEHQGEANRAIEADNDGSTPAKEPMSNVTISNLTFIGSDYSTADKDSEGVYLREGTKATIYNSVLTGAAGECFEVEGNDVSVGHLENGDIALNSVVIACDEATKNPKDENEATAFDLTTLFGDTTTNLIVDNAYLAENGQPIAHDDSPLTGDNKVDVASVANMNGLEATTFVGALDGVNDWRDGWAFGFGGGVSSVAGCPAGSAKVESADGSTTTCELSGTIRASMTLTNDVIWALNGPVFVGGDKEDSATLSIDAGTKVFGSNGGDYLVVSRGSKIEAIGTAEAPITFTSRQEIVGETEGSGQWGGIVLLGQATTNKCTDKTTGEYDDACSIQVEGVTSGGVYGGTDDEDNSGTLKYVVVKNAGFEVAPDNELNGITFAAVGSGTTVDYVQVHANADDGVEFFGGTVNAKHLVLTGNKDDSVDWDHGYRGKLQFVLIKHDAAGEANRGIEADNDGSTPNKTPMSNPTISNMTIIGGSYTSDDKDSEGIYLREGTKASFYNLVVTNAAGECLEVEGNDVSQGHLTAGDINFNSAVIACSENFKNGSDDVDLTTWWTGSNNANTSTADDMSDVLSGIFTVDTTTATQPTDSFFDTVDFIGAVKDSDNDWTSGWTVGLE